MGLGMMIVWIGVEAFIICDFRYYISLFFSVILLLCSALMLSMVIFNFCISTFILLLLEF
jgi:hypothetical protein